MGETQFGPYRLVHQVAVGGMAEIHLAKTSGIAGFEKYVALKMIHPNFSQDAQFIQMLIDEAKITVQLQHVNIAQTFDLGRVDRTYYITMEYVDGADLYKVLRKSSEQDLAMPVDVAAYVAKEVATGLDYAHRKRDVAGRPLRIVHRDVSPQNVLISHAGEVKIVDFGIAKAAMRVRQTAVGVIKGKYYYMSPEQAWGDPLDHRTDVFSTGILLYEMLTGQMLYLEEDLHKLLQVVRRAAVQPPTRLRRDIPPQLERIVMNALKKHADDRYQSAADLATDLERFLHVYSPVFTAAKVSRYFHKVLGEQTGIVETAVEVDEPRVPARATRVTQDQLLRERSDFSDENSVIFRINELQARRPTSDSFGEDTGPTSNDPFYDRLAAAAPPARPPPRAADVNTLDIPLDHGLEDIEERTMISGPPGFGAPAMGQSPGAGGEDFGDADFDQTIVQSSFDAPASEGEDEEGPTLARSPGSMPRSRARATSQPPPTRGPLRKPPPGVPAHPALAARAQQPAVSALRKPRQSRRTPPAGVPAAAGGSLISSLVERAVGVGPPAPAPAPGGVRSDGVPDRVRSDQSAPPRNRAMDPPAPDQPLPHAAQVISPSPAGFPLAPPMQTPNPFNPIPGPPRSFTKELIALQVDAIPDAYKIGRKRSPWILRGVLALVCVTAGVAIGVVALRSGDSKAREATVLVESIPPGASVRIDGRSVGDKTPTVARGVTPGGKYKIEVSKAGYREWTSEVVLGDRGGETKVMAFLRELGAVLAVESIPSGAQVVLNGRVIGRTPLTIDGLEEATARTIELRKKGYRPTRRALTWPDSRKLRLTIKLKK